MAALLRGPIRKLNHRFGQGAACQDARNSSSDRGELPEQQVAQHGCLSRPSRFGFRSGGIAACVPRPVAIPYGALKPQRQ